jgi:hypothetical protein
LAAELGTSCLGLEMTGKVLGEGSHSKVYVGSLFMTPVAVKVYSEPSAFKREYTFFKRAKHPHIP